VRGTGHADIDKQVRGRGVVLKKKWGTPETRLRQRFLNNLGLHTRTLIHIRKIATADLVLSCDTATHVLVSVADR